MPQTPAPCRNVMPAGMPPHPGRAALPCRTTSEHVHDGALQPHGQRLGAGEAAGPTGQVLGGDGEAAAGFSHQQIFTGSREGESQPIKGHVVGGARCLAPPTTPVACAVPLLSLTHAVGGGGVARQRREDESWGSSCPGSEQLTLSVGGILESFPCPGQSGYPSSSQFKGLGIPNVAVLLDGSVGRIPLPTVTAGAELGRHAALVLGRGRGQRGTLEGCLTCHPVFQTARGVGAVPWGTAGPAVPHAAPSRTYQQHSARGTHTASHAVWGAGVVGTRAVTGEKAGTRDIDKVTGAECPLGATMLSRAIPEAPLLADTAEDRSQVRSRPKAGLTLRHLWSDLGESQEPRGSEPLMLTLET